MGVARGGGRLVVLSLPVFPNDLQAYGNNLAATVLLAAGLGWHIRHPPAADAALPQAAGELQLHANNNAHSQGIIQPCPTRKIQPVLDHIDADFDNSLERLFALLRIKSISADPAFADDCKAAADHLAKDIATLGFKAEVRPTAGHPAIVAKANGKANGRAAGRMFCSTAITMCSRSIRSICGTVRRSSPSSPIMPTAARSSLRAAPRTTRDS